MKKQKNVEVEWSYLPDDVLPIICRKLIHNPIDPIRFGAVCRLWYSVYKEIQHGLSRQAPPMLFIYANLPDDPSIRYLYSTEKIVYRVRSSLPDTFWVCRGASHGWLVTVSVYGEVSLLNPFLPRNCGIALPSIVIYNVGHDLPKYSMQGSQVHKAVVSKSPASNPNSYEVMAIYDLTPGSKGLAYYKAGNMGWIYLNYLSIYCIHDAIYYIGTQEFYVVTNGGRVFACDVKDPMGPNFSDLSPIKLGDGIKYLVESGKDLLVIVRRTRRIYSRIREYVTFRFDVLKFVPETRKWEEVRHLSGRVLFVGDNSSLSLPASDVPGCKPNSIYFTHHGSRNYHIDEPRDMGIFNMDDGSIERHDEWKTGKNSFPPIWIVPSP